MVWAATIAVALGVLPARAEAPGNLEALRQQALELVNQARIERGLSQLKPGHDLDEAAQLHAEDMLRRGYFSHTSPQGGNVQGRYVAAGGSRWELVAENIARCDGCAPPVTNATVEWLQNGWMNSPEHRENILRQGLTRFGFGVAADARKGLYAVQTFAGPGTPPGGGQGEAQAALSHDEIVARATALINAARRQANVGDLRASTALSGVARNLLPNPNAGEAALDIDGKLYDALPTDERGQWRSLSVVAGSCGGCGADPTEADIRSFRDQWLATPRYKPRLLDPDATSMGFVMRANGSGRKTAVLVLGAAR